MRKKELLSDAYRKVIYWFFAYPQKEVSLNDLTRLVNISKTTANKTVLQLAHEKFLKIDSVGNVWRISCNQQHPFCTTRKIPYNLGLIYESGVIGEILKIVPNARSIILFGSYRKGDDIGSSDVDIAVEVLGDRDVNLSNLRTILQLGYRKNVKVNILKFSRAKIDLNLFANIANGIVIYGFFEARP